MKISIKKHVMIFIIQMRTYERELKYVEPDDFCDSTYRLHKYTDDPCRVPLEEAYAGIMDGYMIQKENSSSDSSSLVE